jgi:AIR synthase-related protein
VTVSSDHPLGALIHRLRSSLGILHKQDIQTAAQVLHSASQTLDLSRFGFFPPDAAGSKAVWVGDDCAAIPDTSGYLLFAAEGLLPQFLETDPWFAGWCAVMVNVSDVYAMGGRPVAVVDTLWSASDILTQSIFAGMQAAAIAYQVPIVGGHTNTHSPYTALSVAILGRAQQLISGFNAQPGDILLMVADFRGGAHSHYDFWNAATDADPQHLRACLEILPGLAESGYCDAGKDISMGGLMGTLLMLMETSGRGAVLDLDQIPYPTELSLEQWLVSFPSYGFLLSVRPALVPAVQKIFAAQGLVCAAVGTVQPSPQVYFKGDGEQMEFWDLAKNPLTGFGRSPHSSP